MTTIQFRTPYAIRSEHESQQARRRKKAIVAGIAAALVLAGLLALTGCKTPGGNQQITKALVTVAVQNAVAFGVDRSTNAIPYLRAATPIICSAAAGTNIQPVEIVAALESSTAAQLKTIEATLIINSVLGIYSAVFAEYGVGWTNQPYLQSILSGCCDGLKSGLPPVGPGGTSLMARPLGPHVK